MLLSWIFLAATAVSRVSAGPPHHGHDNIVDLGYVKYLGNRTFPNANTFLGIPYAEPPVGPRRFRAPAPLDTRRVSKQAKGKVVDARGYPLPCVQLAVSGVPDGFGTEDCLKLNIWAPAGAKKGDNLPVLVYIPGGGFVFGGPNPLQFDHWVEQSPNVVIVSIAYRLGVFGFLATPSFNNPANGDFNAGLKDQIEALKWIRKYISRFGGDPTKVTISGESAGASSVQLLLISHGTEGLFHRAIGQSVWRGTVVSPENIQPLFEYIATHVGCTTPDASAALACMRTATTRQISDAHDSIPIGYTGPFTRFMPTLDGQLITEYPTHAYLGGRFVHVPLIVGATTDDSVAFTSVGHDLQTNWPLLTTQDINDIASLYPASNYATEGEHLRSAVGESQFLCARSLMGTAYSAQPISWTYRYNEPSPAVTSPALGRVSHAAELWLMGRGLRTLPQGQWEHMPMTPAQQALAEEFIAYWISFVRSGNPNTYKLARSPAWPAYTQTTRNRIVLQKDSQGSTTQSGITLETETQAETDRCAVIYTKADHQQN